MSVRQPTFVSLYSGCGGLDLGFLQAGFRNILSCDHDVDAEEAHKLNLSTPFLRADLTVVPAQVVEAAKTADALVAGPPCQGFSTAGRNDADDVRNRHLLQVLKIAAIARPRLVVIENVRGLLGPRYAEYWKNLTQGLVDIGYQIQAATYNAADFGAAQSRKRVILFAALGCEPPKLEATHSATALTLRDVLKGVEHAPDHSPRLLDLRGEAYKIAQAIQPGQKLSNVRCGPASIHTWDIPEVFGATSDVEKKLLGAVQKLRRQNRVRNFGDADPVDEKRVTELLKFDASSLIHGLILRGYLKRVGNLIDLTHTFNGKFRRLSWAETAPTVDTRFGQPRYFLHPSENRGFTVREAARIQGFPDAFTFSRSLSANFRLIGNAVPPPFAKAIANASARTLREHFHDSRIS